ncbi:MFS transporter [Hyphomonas sp.]|jgi:MFS family permease|uniref:MFS transporter n=1 Tax=Hyphomonas sp. TaxID=87 RepID=UPI0030032717|tara:strand:+ start:6428 stop:7774 length:1347 start_codon:yes stop_codon:yes gene_type:complete
MSTRVPFKAGSQLVAMSSLELLLAAATYSSLGVVLPFMVMDLEWNWAQAGFGFTVLGAVTGVASSVPPLLIRRLGVRNTVLIGGLLASLGLYLLHGVNSLPQYYIAAAICGLAYPMMASIPTTFLVSRLFQRQSTALGVAATISGMGTVVGPLMVLGVLALQGQTWRNYWEYQALAILAATVLCVIIIGLERRFSRPARDELIAPEAEPVAPTIMPDQVETAPPRRGRNIYRTSVDWTTKVAMRTSQFKILAAAYCLNMMCLVTVTSLSVGHLIERGVPETVAGGMLSIEALIAVLIRGFSGVLGDIFDPKHLVSFALCATMIGCAVLALTADHVMLLFYAVGTGIGFGTTQLACTVLLLNYFGRKYNLELFSAMCVTGAISALGPLIGGVIRDVSGSFSLIFLLLSVLSAGVFMLVLFMKPPYPDELPASVDESVGDADIEYGQLAE